MTPSDASCLCIALFVCRLRCSCVDPAVLFVALAHHYSATVTVRGANLGFHTFAADAPSLVIVSEPSSHVTLFTKPIDSLGADVGRAR